MKMTVDQLHVGEIELIQTQYGGDLGSFKTALWDAITSADNTNLIKLEKGFPEQVRAYRDYISKDGYWVDVLTRAGLIAAPAQVPADSSAPDSKAGRH